MALCTVRKLSQLGPSLVLAPERYDPRREVSRNHPDSVIRLGELVRSVRQTVSPGTVFGSEYLILDTSHAREGVVIYDKGLVAASEIGSAKKTIAPGDVIISRLRPYLRQVAFVDADIRGYALSATILCSTEFFVLRATGQESIAFLVPFLLSQSTQQVLAASQEGGHHPRFDEAALLGLQVPLDFIKARKELSEGVEHSVDLYRQSEKGMLTLIQSAENIGTAA